MYHVTTTLKGKRVMVPSDSLIPRSASYALIIKDEKMLLVSVKTTGKLWFPGGKVDEGESMEEALLRECREEVALHVEIERELLETQTTFYYEGAQEAYNQVAKFYICHPSTEKLTETVINDAHDEAEKPQWYTIADLTENQFQDYGFQVIERYKESL